MNIQKFNFNVQEALDNLDPPLDFRHILQDEFPACCGATIWYEFPVESLKGFAGQLEDDWEDQVSNWSIDNYGEEWSESKKRYVTRGAAKPKKPEKAHFTRIILDQAEKELQERFGPVQNHHIHVCILNEDQKWIGDLLEPFHFRLVSDRVRNGGGGGNRLYMYIRDWPATPKGATLKKRSF